MAINPLFNTNDSPNRQTTPTKAVNNQGVYVPRTHNTFDMSYFNFKTQRFGQYEPFFVMEGVAGDRIPFSSSHNVRSLPFATPFLSSLQLNKDYFLVPNQAIQPWTWEYIFKNPSQGDDVPDDAYNVFDLYGSINHRPNMSIIHFLLDHFSNEMSYVSEDSVDNIDLSSKYILGSLLSLELFLSTGSLLYNLGYKLNPVLHDANDDVFSFDSFFDAFVDKVSFSFTYDGVTYSTSQHGNSILLDLIRFVGLSSITFTSFSFNGDASAYIGCYFEGLPARESKASEFNMDRLCAYQMCCSQYFVNPQVDYLYNAQLYRDNFKRMVLNLDPEYSSRSLTFGINGIPVYYDSFSKYYYNLICQTIFDIQIFDPASIYDVLSILFGYKESLKFGDYFTDSRTRPLAVGDTSINVSADNSVSVVDISQKIVYQRFWNNVVKLGNNFGDYLRGIFGTSPSPDYHFPKFIIHQDFEISGFETANTSTETGTMVSQLRSGDDTFVFEVDIDMPCVLIGISHFSVPQIYSQTKDRTFLHTDRFDFFNPMLQYVGDQPVYICEKTDDVDNQSDILGYQSRYNEYKQRYSVVSGGFLEKLPAWSFVVDDKFDPFSDLTLSLTQSPLAIRNLPFMFNRFFKAIGGYSLSSSFHFILVYNNKAVCNRPMEINPGIL